MFPIRCLLLVIACVTMAVACDSADPVAPTGPTGGLEATGGELTDPASFTIASATVSVDGWVAVWHEFGSSHTLAGSTSLNWNTVLALAAAAGSFCRN